MKTKRKRGGLLMTTGLLLLAAALFLTVHNVREQRQADSAAYAALALLREEIPQTGTPAPCTLQIVDAVGEPMDWPLDEGGEPLSWPVDELGAPLQRITDSAGRVYLWPTDENGQLVWEDKQAWTRDETGALLPWLADTLGHAIPWPQAASGLRLSWTQIAQEWSQILSVLLPYQAYEAPQPVFVEHPDMEMPVERIDGQDYIGIVEIPALELSLPVISEWSDPKLKLAPCRYAGSVYSHDMVISGHNYDRHFGRLKNLKPGDEVTFMDAAGNRFQYTVSAMETLGARESVRMVTADDWDLTLFTCTVGGITRVTVRCVLERYEAVGD